MVCRVVTEIWSTVYNCGKGNGKGERGFVYRLLVNTPLKRSCVARVLKGSHSFTCTARVYPLTE